MPTGMYRRHIRDRAGMVKGELTVIRLATGIDLESYPVKRSASEQKIPMWLVRCSCGKRLCISTLRLEHAFVVSCGCKRGRGLSKRVCKPGDASEPCRRDCYTSNRNKAKQRGIDWQLSYEEFCQITKRNCFYCDSPPSNIQKPKHVRKLTSEVPESYVYSGLDRHDNDLGYSVENAVPCCLKCNQAKSDLTVAEFKQWVSRIHGTYVNDTLLYNG